MINRYLLACILSTCYLSNEVMASNARKARELALAKRQQLAAAAVAPVNVDKPLADEGRALQRVNTLFGADPNVTVPNILSGGIKGQITEVRNLNGLNSLFGANPNTTAPNILSGGIQGQITQVRALHGVGDLVGVANFNAEPYLTTLDGAARAQLGHVHDFHEVDDLIAEANFEQQPYQTTLHADARAQLGHVHDFNLVQDFVGEANFEQQPYQTALHADARTQLGRVHAFHEVNDLAAVGNNALNDGQDNEFTTVLDNGLRHQMKGLQMVLKPSSIPDNLYNGAFNDRIKPGFGTHISTVLALCNSESLTIHVREALIQLADDIILGENTISGTWQNFMHEFRGLDEPTLEQYLVTIRGMILRKGLELCVVDDVQDSFIGSLKSIIREMLLRFPIVPVAP